MKKIILVGLFVLGITPLFSADNKTELNISFAAQSLPFKAVGVLPYSGDVFSYDKAHMITGFRMSEMSKLSDKLLLGVESGLLTKKIEKNIFTDEMSWSDETTVDNFSIDRLSLVPILLKGKYNLTESEPVSVSLDFGAGFYGYHVRERYIEYYSDLNDPDEDYIWTNKSDVFKIKPAVEIGIGCDYKLTDNLFLKLAGNIGLTSKVDMIEVDPDTGEAEGIKFGGFSWGAKIGVTYKF